MFDGGETEPSEPFGGDKSIWETVSHTNTAEDVELGDEASILGVVDEDTHAPRQTSTVAPHNRHRLPPRVWGILGTTGDHMAPLFFFSYFVFSSEPGA